MIYLPKRLFVAAKDTSGSDDFYLYSSLANKIEWRQVFHRAGECAEVIDDTNLVLHQFGNVVLIQLVFASVCDWSYISTDRGQSWNTFFTILPPAVVYGGINENIIYASDQHRLYYTTDKGNLWHGLPEYPFFIAGNAVKVHSYGSLLIVFFSNGLILRNTNYGNPGFWSSINTGLSSMTKPLIVGNLIFCFASNGSSVRSNDSGLSWSAVFPSPVPGATFYDADISDEEQSTIVMTLDSSIYLSYDFGLSWICMGSAPFNLHYIVQSHGQHLLSVNNSGYYVESSCFGESSDVLPFDVGNPDIRPFAIRKVSAQEPEAYESKVARVVNDVSKITIAINKNSKVDR